MANATEISGSQFITSSTFDNNEHFGFAQYVNYRRVNNIGYPEILVDEHPKNQTLQTSPAG